MDDTARTHQYECMEVDSSVTLLRESTANEPGRDLKDSRNEFCRLECSGGTDGPSTNSCSHLISKAVNINESPSSIISSRESCKKDLGSQPSQGDRNSVNAMETSVVPGVCDSRPPSTDDFVLVKPISKGAFGKVWLGFKKTNPDRMYAIKVMKKADLINKNLIAQVTAERDAQARSRSAFIVQLYYSLQSRQNIFLIMDYMIGGDVKSLLIMYGFFPEDMSCFYAAEVTLALAYLHKLGIVHRDLKPDNMLISDSGHIKLTDFGLSKITMDFRTSPQPGCFTPFDHRHLSYVDLRTPGQILSLKSSLAFTVGASACKQPQPRSDGEQVAVVDSPPVASQAHSPLPPEPRTPQDKAHRQSFGRRMLTPAGSKQVHRLHSTVVSTPPVKSLTPTLQESLSWRNSSASDAESRRACSALQSSLMRVSNMENLSELFHKGDLDTPVSDEPRVDVSEMDISANSNADCSLSKDMSDFECCEDCMKMVANSMEGEKHRSLKDLQDPLSCDSHVMPIFRAEDEENDTPMLHRTHSSVWSSCAAKFLRSMREGSYSENCHYGSFCSSLGASRGRSDAMHSVSSNTPDAVRLQDSSSQHDSSMNAFAKLPEHSSSDLFEKNDEFKSTEKLPCDNVPLLHDSQALENLSVEIPRGIVSSFDESLDIVHSHRSRLVSVPGSTDLEVSSDFSASLQHRDHIFNSTRISLDFGPSLVSLDSGPELKDLSQLSGLSRMPLRSLAPEGNMVPNFNVVPSKKSERLVIKQNDLGPGSGPLVRKLSRPGLRRVLSDTFDKCLTYNLSAGESNSKRSILNHKSKSLDYSSDSSNKILTPLPDSNKLQRKRPFQKFLSESSDGKEVDVLPAISTNVTPDFCRMKLKEIDSERPRKQICADRSLHVHSSSSSMPDRGWQDFSTGSKLAPSPTEKPEHRNFSNLETVNLKQTFGLGSNILGTPCKKMNLNKKPQHPKVAFLRETNSSQLLSSNHTGLTDEVNALGLRDIVTRFQTSKVATDKLMKTVELIDENGTMGHFADEQGHKSSVGKVSETESGSVTSEGTDDARNMHSEWPLKRVPASVDLSSHYDSPFCDLHNAVDDLEVHSKENDVKFFIATPSPGPAMHSSPTTGNTDLPTLIIKKDILSLDSSMGNDNSFLNVTIEYEGDGAQADSPLAAGRRSSRSSSASSLPDTGCSECSIQLTEGGPSVFRSDQPVCQPAPFTPAAISSETEQESDSFSSDGQRQLLVKVSNSGGRLVGRQQKMLCSAHKRMPCIAEGVTLLEEDDQATFVKPLSCVVDFQRKPAIKSCKQQNKNDSVEETGHSDTSLFPSQKPMPDLVKTPNPRPRDSALQTPCCTPGAQHQASMCVPGGRLQTPLRTPKSVRRGPEVIQDEGRILGTPDYLAPEILLQKPHGFAVDWWALGVCLYEFLTGLPPFNDQTAEAVFENILNRNITWPEGEEAISDEAKAAIEALLTYDVDKRPAAEEVKAMPFFSHIDWANLLNMEAPFVPQPDDHMDTAYFEPKNAVRNLVLSAVDM